jgi:hypothetical protein
MLNRTVLFLVICLVILALAELVTVVTSVSPAIAGRGQLWFFFGSFWIVLTAILGSIWHLFKSRLVYYRARTVPVFVSLRQAGLVALVATLALFFNSLQILSVWDILPLAISMLLVEFFFEAETGVIHDLGHGSRR